MLQNKGRPNRLGVWGWLGGGRWGWERYLYTLHRLTGLGLLAYFLMHIIVTSTRALGRQPWENAMGTPCKIEVMRCNNKGHSKFF